MSLTLPKFLVLFLTLILGINAWAVANSGYYFIWWLDEVLHFAGGAWLSLFSFWFMFRRKDVSDIKAPMFLIFFAMVMFAVFVGVLWEFFEFGWDHTFVQFGIERAQPDLADTMDDLFFDMLGGVVSSFCVLYFYLKK